VYVGSVCLSFCLCLSVYLLVMTVIPAKIAELMKMPIGMLTLEGQEPYIKGSPDTFMERSTFKGRLMLYFPEHH